LSTSELKILIWKAMAEGGKDMPAGVDIRKRFRFGVDKNKSIEGSYEE
jgi:hypothetical protein